MQAQQEQRCSISFCTNTPQYRCSRCHIAIYCGRSHQRLHWNSGHKIQCMTPEEKKKHDAKIEKQNKDNMIDNKRRIFRKNYVDSYSTAKIQDYVPISRILEEAQEENVRKTKFANEDDIFNYGFTVCIAIKSLYVAGNLESARSKIQTYIKKNKQFLTSVDSYTKTRPSGITNDERMIYYEKKLQLISVLANLSYAVGISHHYLYAIYASHLQNIQNECQNEVSNMYFLLGCDYAEQGFPEKAIACFRLCAEKRGQETQTCFFNIAILFFWMGKTNQSIVYFNKTLQKRQLFYGQSSSEVAEVYKNLGSVYLSKFDFHTSDYYYSRSISMIINSKGEDRTNPYYQKLQQSIQNLFRKLCSYLKSEPSQAQKPELYHSLKQTMLNNKKYPSSLIKSFKRIMLQVDSEPINYYWAEEFKNRKNIIVFKADGSSFLKVDNTQFNKIHNPEQDSDDERNQLQKFKKKKNKKVAASKPKEQFTFSISDKLMSLLDSDQLMFAIDAQQKLSYVLTIQKAVRQIQRSPFIQSMNQEQYQVFRNDNKSLYSKLNEQESNKSIRKSSIVSKQEQMRNQVILKQFLNFNKEDKKKQTKITKSFISIQN